MLSSESLEQLGERIRVMVKKSDDYLVSAGLELIAARKRIQAGEGGGMTFARFLLEHCELSKSRAYELMRIAEGKTTAEETRARARRGMAASRMRSGSSSTGGKSSSMGRKSSSTGGKHHARVRNVTHSTRLSAALATFDALNPLERKEFLARRGLQPEPKPQKRAA